MVRVTDTGVGLRHTGGSLGTGLATLRERLQIVFGDEAALVVTAGKPRGVTAELDMPAREAAP
jgi:LytS/YehU family sensor histidine kinase